MLNDRYQILIVDDDPQIPRLIKTWLDRRFSSTADVLGITNPQEALGRIHNESIDLLITDLDMPSVNGYHLLRELKAIEPMSQVLILTGQPSVNAIRSAMQMGADEFVLKPAKCQYLVRCVKFLLDRAERWRKELGIDFGVAQDFATATD